MSSHGTTPMAAPATSDSDPLSSISHVVAPEIPVEKIFPSPFTIFSNISEGSAAVTGNVEKFSVCYAVFIWIALFITVVQKNKLSMMNLVATSYIILLYIILLHVLPDLVAFYKQIGVQSQVLLVLLVMFLVGSITILALFLTQGETLLFIALAAMMPLLGLYNVLSKGDDDMFVNDELGVFVVSLAENFV